MSQLEFLEKLLDGDEIEWRPLKDLLVRTKGTKITAAKDGKNYLTNHYKMC